MSKSSKRSKPSEIIKQRQWTEEELRAAGFTYYPRKKQLVMVRPVTEMESPLALDLGIEQVVVDTNYLLCYLAGEEVKSRVDQYEHWAIRADVFAETYHRWDEPNWVPTPAEQDLLDHGCQPYYKVAGVWARQLDIATLVQSIERSEPTVVAPGNWLAIGAQGEPWAIEDEAFHLRYSSEDGDTTAQ